MASRITGEKRKSRLTPAEKDRLLRMAKRPRKGPFNSVLDPSEYKSGTSVVELSQAVKASGRYDPWQSEEEVVLPDGLETVQKKNVKVRRHRNHHIYEIINIDDRYPSYLIQKTPSMHLLLLNHIKEHPTTLPLKRIKNYYGKRMKKRRSESSMPRGFLISGRD